MMYDDVNTYFDKVFYINLPHDTNRNEAILKQFEKFNIQNYERVEGFELTELPDISQYRNFNKFDRRYVLGSLGCRLSHLQVVKTAKERGYKRVLIFEDDILITQDLRWLLAANENILHDWDVLYWGGLVEPFFRNQIVCLHAYAVRNTVFDDVLYMAENSGMEIDNFYAKILQHMSFNGNQSGKYNIRMIEPFNTIIQNKKYITNIQKTSSL